MQLLGPLEIDQKTTRLAIEILEQNYGEKEIILAGINNAGSIFALKLKSQLEALSKIKIKLSRISLNPANPLDAKVEVDMALENMVNKVIILVDDVANTGRTIQYAMKPLLEILPKKVEVAVLVDRKHKSFPIKVDYVGLTLATTLEENIRVELTEKKSMVFLD